jgi:hypothetical protein
MEANELAILFRDMAAEFIAKRKSESYIRERYPWAGEKQRQSKADQIRERCEAAQKVFDRSGELAEFLRDLQ